MKNSILTIAGMVLVGIITAQAQSDSTQSPIQEPAHQYRMEDRIEVPSTQLPSTMKQALKGDEYTGWEKSTIYRDKSSNNYYFDMKNGDMNKTYQFDQNGKRLENPYSSDGLTPSPNSSGNPNKSGSSTKPK